ncbi:MAG: biopolymer transporter ExbD [Planctomycetota bacterium]|nr:MAG: biopolymer transporter ExbD [Planctomycetota bacterium]
MSRRRQAETEVEVDMTPMIDLTFLMIIFFIIVNDLSQQELEDLKLPIAVTAVNDEPPPNRPILNVMPDGEIRYKRKPIYWDGIEPVGTDPIRKGRPDYYWKLAETMVTKFVANMEYVYDEKLKKELPDDPVLIRADRNTAFKHIQKIMEVCTRQEILIWRIQLAASEPEKD